MHVHNVNPIIANYKLFLQVQWLIYTASRAKLNTTRSQESSNTSSNIQELFKGIEN